MNPSPPLDPPFLSAFVRECHWMSRSRDWKERLLLRLAQAHLDLLTQMAIERGVAEGIREAKKTWTADVKKRKS